MIKLLMNMVFYSRHGLPAWTIRPLRTGQEQLSFSMDTPAAGSVIEKEVTLTFEQFNDANYRAFARLKDGSYVYGEVMYFASA